MAAEGQILAAAGGRLECPLVLRQDAATGAVLLIRLDAATGAVLLLRLGAAPGAASVTSAVLLLPGVPRGGANTNGPLADGFHLDSAAVAQFLLDAASDAVVTLRLDAATGAVRLLRVDAASGAVLPLCPDAATGAVPPLGLAASPDPEPPLGLAATADVELGRVRLAVDTDGALLLRLAGPVGAAPLLRLAVPAGAVPPLGLAAAPDREPPLGLAVATDAEPLLRQAAAADADAAPLLRLAMAADAPLLLRLATAVDGTPLLRLAVAAYAARLLGLATAADAAHPHHRVQPVRDEHAAVFDDFDDIRRRGPNADPPFIRSGGAAPTISQRTTAYFDSEGAAAAAAMSRTTPDFDALVALLMDALPTRATQRGERRLKRRRVKKTVQVTIRKLVQARSENASSDSSNKLVRFKCILGDFVWFAVPSVLLFYPKKVEAEMQQSKLQVSLTWLELFSTKDLEKKIAMTVFVISLSVWILAYLLASLGRGMKCTRVVGHLTLATVLSVMALVDYSLYKTTAPSYTVLFAAHFTVMASLIIYIWKKYVCGTNQELGLLCAIKAWRGWKLLSAIKGWRGWKFLRSQPAVRTESLSEPLIGTNMV